MIGAARGTSRLDPAASGIGAVASEPSEVEPLALGRPALLLGLLRGPASTRRHVRAVFWSAVALNIALVIGLGTWGFHRLTLGSSPGLGWGLSAFRAIRLYTLDLGPAAGGGRARPDWQLWVALVLAALLVLRGAIALWRERLRRTATHRLLRGHVIVCGAGVHGAKLTERLAADHDVVLIDLDPQALGMRAPRGAYEWRRIGDCVQPQTLIGAGIARAHWLVAITGDDFVNSQIAAAVRALAEQRRVRDGLQLLVQVEDPELARFLEDEEQGLASAPGRRVVVSPFSPNAIAAERLLGDAEESTGEGGRRQLLRMHQSDQRRRAPNLLLAGDHPLLDALTLAVLRRWRVRILRENESSSGRRRPPVHISVIGPNASARVQALRGRWRPEPRVLRLEAHDSSLDEEPNAKLAAWLADEDRADHAIVVCEQELDGVGLTLTLARALGGRMELTRVTTLPDASAMDEHMRRRTHASDQLASTDVESIAELACDPGRMSRLSSPRRLADALLPRPRDAAGDPAQRGRAQRRARSLFEQRHALDLRSDWNWRISECEQPLLQALLDHVANADGSDPVPLSALVRAGLRIELAHPANLLAAARTLSERGSPHAFAAWCEYARRMPLQSGGPLGGGVTADDAARGEDAGGGAPAAGQSTSGRRDAPCPLGEQIVRLRRASLGDHSALCTPAEEPSPLAGASRVTIFAGPRRLSPAIALALVRLLGPALARYDGAVIIADEGQDGEQEGEELRQLVARLAGQAGVRLHSASGGEAVARALAVWSEILAAGITPQEVRLLVVGGDPEALPREQILLARALGGRVAWFDPDGTAAPIDERLPTGSDQVLVLPADRMTIRAFVNSSRLDDAELRERLAAYIHNDYRRKHRGRKPPDDPALAPWEELIDSLRASNLAQADDIPGKLALVGRRLERAGAPLALSEAEVELLAEVEHGRWNVERLSADWSLGERQVAQAVSPDLIPWSDLDHGARAYDAEAVRNIGPALASLGWGVAPLQEAGSEEPQLLSVPRTPA